METYYKMINENKCPFCRNKIALNVQKCKYCGEWLNNHCPVCSKIIPPNSTICPECKTTLIKKENNKLKIFRVLSLLSLLCCLGINIIFSFLGLYLQIDCSIPENQDKMYGIATLYVFLTCIPFYLPIISLIAGFERKISALATIINYIGFIFFLICFFSFSFGNLNFN